MDKSTKIKCFGCGVLLATIIGAESLPLVCDKCHHISVLHLPEQHYAVGTAYTIAAISGISDTAMTHIFPWSDSDIS